MEKYKFGIIRGEGVPDEPLTTNITNAVEVVACEFYAADVLSANTFANNIFKLWGEQKELSVGAGKYIKTPVVLAHLYE